MLHIKRYKEWLINESNSNSDNGVSNYFILDGASSSGKSAISKSTIYHGYKEYCGKMNSDHYPVIVEFDFSDFLP